MLESDDSASSEPARECDRFVAQPGLSVDERFDALENSVECSSASNPFPSLRNLPFGRENTYRLGLSATQNLFTGGRLRRLSQSADAGVRSAQLGLTSAQAQTLFDATQAYYDATLGDRLVAIAEATLQQADTTLGQAQLAKDVGNQSEFELLRARVTRDNRRPVVIQRRADRDLAYIRLKQLLDVQLAQPLELTTALGDSTLAGAEKLAAGVPEQGDTGVERRVVVRQAVEAVTSQEGQLRVARSQRLPQITLSSDYADLAYPGSGSPIGTDYISDWSLSVALTLPLFTGGRIKGEVESGRGNVEQAELRLKQTRERAQLDARTAQLQLEAAVAAWEASAGTEEQAARAYQIAELRYREGSRLKPSSRTSGSSLPRRRAPGRASRAICSSQGSAWRSCPRCRSRARLERPKPRAGTERPASPAEVGRRRPRPPARPAARGLRARRRLAEAPARPDETQDRGHDGERATRKPGRALAGGRGRPARGRGLQRRGRREDPSGETRDVEVRLAPEARRRAEDLRQLPLVVPGPDGRAQTLPLGQVARIDQSLGPAVINHLNRDLVVNVEWNVSGRSTGEVNTEVLARVRALQLPAGVTYTSSGDAEQQNEVFGNIFIALGVAVMLMYLILVMQFGSFVDPLAILMSLPLSLIGVMLGLAVTGLTVNIMSLIGVILLAGIVAKNAILLIDFAKWAREKDGLALREALIQAGAIRLRPILMTTFALIAGMIPVALGRGEGAQLRQPLGVAVIGGTITSTLLTLLVIPTVYEILDEIRHWLIARFRRVVPAAHAEGVPHPAPARAE